MSYKITIEENTTVQKMSSREYQVIGKDADGDDEWGHAPSIMELQDYNLKIYEQTVWELDIGKLVNLINTAKGER
jgi:hypothetical protein